MNDREKRKGSVRHRTEPFESCHPEQTVYRITLGSQSAICGKKSRSSRQIT
jgi:hypothetical protein